MTADLDTLTDTLMESLTHHVRGFSHDQIASIVGSDDATEILDALLRRGLVERASEVVTGDVSVTGPLLSWSRRSADPDCKRLASVLRGRVGDAREVGVIYPTSKACRVYGGTRVRPRRSEVTHDLRMSSVFLHYHDRLAAEGVLSWASGDEIRSDGETGEFLGTVPDACLRRADGTVERIVEIGGSGYGTRKLIAMTAVYREVAAYEIW